MTHFLRLSMFAWILIAPVVAGDEIDEAVAALERRGARVELDEGRTTALVAFSKSPVMRADVGNLAILKRSLYLNVTLRGGQFGDRDVELVSKTKGLRRLALIKTRTTPKVIDQLHRSFPDLSIVHTDGPYLGLALTADAKVRRIRDNTPAGDAGLQVGDKVVSFGGERIMEIHDLLRLVSRCKPGDLVELQIRRAGRSMTLMARIGKLDMQ